MTEDKSVTDRLERTVHALKCDCDTLGEMVEY